MAIKYTTCPINIPDGHKIYVTMYQMAIKISNGHKKCK
jgi:hypothetical protein